MRRRSAVPAVSVLAALWASVVLPFAPASAQVTAIRAGRLLDPASGTVSANQVILVEQGKFTAVGAERRRSRGARRSSTCRTSP
jgi:hypothetical protein